MLGPKCSDATLHCLVNMRAESLYVEKVYTHITISLLNHKHL